MINHLTPHFSRRSEGSAEVLPINTCHINYSSVRVLSGKGTSRSYSLKYVLSGLEQYQINGRRYGVETGKFLVVAPGSEVSVEINSKKPVEAVRFFLTRKVVQDVWQSLFHNEAQLLETGDNPAADPVFFENIFDGRQDQLGSYLMVMGQKIKSGEFPYQDLDEEFFYGLAQDLCLQQQQHLVSVGRVPAHKQSTREELYRRLLQAQDYIQNNYTRPLGLDDLARIANISEFHFLRSFKQVFGISPYQYLLQLRLKKAKELLRGNNHSISETAHLCGFKEVPSFAKLFRKAFCMGPAIFMKQNHK